jgi:hypothetical protein
MIGFEGAVESVVKTIAGSTNGRGFMDGLPSTLTPATADVTKL